MSPKKKKKKKNHSQMRQRKRAIPFDVDGELQKAIHFHETGHIHKAELIYKKILKVAPTHPDCLHFLGVVFHQLGKDNEAEVQLKKAIASNPDIAHFHSNLGLVLHARGKSLEALHSYEKAHALNPENPEGYLNMGNLFFDLGDFKKAISCYEKASELRPEYPEAFNNMGHSFEAQGNSSHAIRCFEQALKLRPDAPELHYNLGNALHNSGEIDLAISCFKKAVRLNPYLKEAFNNMGNAYKDQGKFHEAGRCYTKALNLSPHYMTAFLNLVDIENRDRKGTEKLYQIAKNIHQTSLSEDDLTSLYFALGKLCDHLGLYEEGFDYYSKANTLENRKHPFDTESHEKYVSRIIGTFPRDFFMARQTWGDNREAPIFIVGMPRSGTTLIEQMISSLPDVFGGGELQLVQKLRKQFPHDIQRDLPYPEYVGSLDIQASIKMGETFMREARKMIGAPNRRRRVTDKTPYNFLYLGLISIILPNARIVHSRRNPMDTCVSIFTRKFAMGNDYAFDMTNIGCYYKEYERIMSHWHNTLPIPILDVDYEELVLKPEKTSKVIAEFCGLEWDSKCLEYWTNTRPVFTASNWQVRQPIYTTSIDRWKKYAPYVEPIKKELRKKVRCF